MHSKAKQTALVELLREILATAKTVGELHGKDNKYAHGVDAQFIESALNDAGYDLEAHQDGIFGTVLLIVKKPST